MDVRCPNCGASGSQREADQTQWQAWYGTITILGAVALLWGAKAAVEMMDVTTVALLFGAALAAFTVVVARTWRHVSRRFWCNACFSRWSI